MTDEIELLKLKIKCIEKQIELLELKRKCKGRTTVIPWPVVDPCPQPITPYYRYEWTLESAGTSKIPVEYR